MLLRLEFKGDMRVNPSQAEMQTDSPPPVPSMNVCDPIEEEREALWCVRGRDNRSRSN